MQHRLARLPLTHAVISPAGRTQATAAIILADRQTTISLDPRWAETNHGRWEGLTYADVTGRFREEAAQRFDDPLNGRVPGGESIADVLARVSDGWKSLLDQHSGGRILVVTHATPIQLILCMVSGTPPALAWRWRVDLGSVTAIDVYPGGPIVRVVNEVPKMRDESG